MTEFLHMIPPHVKSLVVCCPSQLRIIPWHLLLIEQASNAPFSGDSASPQASKPTEIHLMERFNVRLGPTLSLFEMNECGGRALRHSVGLHRMCVVDGQADGPERHGGIRGTDLEVACVSNVWSADPDDYRVLSNDAAVPRVIQTGLFGDGVQEDFKQFKQDIYVKRREKIDHTKVAGGDEDFVSRLKAKHEARKSQKGSAGDSRKHGAGEQEGEGENKEGAADGEGSEEVHMMITFASTVYCEH